MGVEGELIGRGLIAGLSGHVRLGGDAGGLLLPGCERAVKGSQNLGVERKVLTLVLRNNLDNSGRERAEVEPGSGGSQ